MFSQGRPPASQDARATPANVLPGPLDEFVADLNQAGNNVNNVDNMNNVDDMNNVKNMQPSTSTPNGNVQLPNIGRGGTRGMVTRSAARYLSTCLYLSLALIVPFVPSLILSNLIYSNLSFVLYPLLF